MTSNESLPFSEKVLQWFDHSGRKHLPWQQAKTPYRVWLSEVMLQQTQVATVIPYFENFTQRFPTVADLAASDIDQVLHLWTGLGYYARGRNLHKAAVKVCEEFNGRFPQSVTELETLPGIGRSTAGAIAALSMDIRAPILDGNVKRVLTRFKGIPGWPEQTKIKNQLWQVAEELLPSDRIADYTQAMMDLGATICTRNTPLCESCPLATDCTAKAKGLTSEIPGKKPKKATPVKNITMLILQDDTSHVLLEKRPPSGIWGGLYSLPELASPKELPLPDFSDFTGTGEKMSPLRHTFSHYHLDITPIKFKTKANSSRIADSDRWLWYQPGSASEVGLAAPIKKLLESL